MVWSGSRRQQRQHDSRRSNRLPSGIDLEGDGGEKATRRCIGGEVEESQVDLEHIDLEGLKSYLFEKRGFLLRLLENPNLLEHDRFADVLWAIFHLQEELEARRSLRDLPLPNKAHLAGDTQRAYTQLAAEWLAYAEHLKANYPYLYSLVLRTHPFQDAPSPVVTA